MAIPLTHRITCPAKRLIQVTQIAGVGDTVFGAGLYVGLGNSVISDGAQERIRRVRHMTVQAIATA